MKGFKLIAQDGVEIRFRYYAEAPVTSEAFAALLPFSKVFMHARTSGEEIWTDKADPLDIMQENASVFTEPGEVVYGPLRPSRVRTVNCMGIYYGAGKGLDSCNIFGKVIDEDMPLLAALGERIWRKGECELAFTQL